MSMILIQLGNVNDEWRSAELYPTATERWLSDMDLREQFLTLPDYVHRLQLMQLGIVPLDATLLP